MSLYQSCKTLDHTYHKCLLLSSQKTGATPPWRRKQQLAMWRLPSSMAEGHHPEQQQFHSHQDDPCQHPKQQTTQHRVIPTRLHHQHPERFNNRIMTISTLIQTIISFQMAVIGASMMSETSFPCRIPGEWKQCILTMPAKTSRYVTHKPIPHG